LIIGAGGDAEHPAERLAELENEEQRAADRETAEGRAVSVAVFMRESRP